MQWVGRPQPGQVGLLRAQEPRNGPALPLCPARLTQWEDGPAPPPGKGVSFGFQAGPISGSLSPNWNSLSLLLRGQAPMTSIRKGALPFWSWPRCFADSSPLCRQRQGRARGQAAHNRLPGHQRVWSGQELTVQGQGTVEVLIVRDKGKRFSLILGRSVPGWPL